MKRYIERFFNLRCGADLMPFFEGSRRNAKEVTESMAMWRAAVEVLGLRPDQDIVALVVGDGRRPRTGALLAYTTAWTIHSIDPQFDMPWWDRLRRVREADRAPIRRLILHPIKAEELQIDCGGKPTVLLFPHSHAPLDVFVRLINHHRGLSAISMPCCVPTPEKMLEKDFALRHGLVTYKDMDVWSPQRTVHVWRDLGSAGKTACS